MIKTLKKKFFEKKQTEHVLGEELISEAKKYKILKKYKELMPSKALFFSNEDIDIFHM